MYAEKSFLKEELLESAQRIHNSLDFKSVAVSIPFLTQNASKVPNAANSVQCL